jgi:predicted DNA-binding transcriptional regulator AlpA
MGLAKLPRQLPPLSALLRDLGNPRPAAVARALGVSERTAWRWLADDEAPRSALLALYWLTSWGASEVVSDARQAIGIARGLADALQRENAALRAEIGRLGAIGDFGSANDPAARPFGAPRPDLSVARYRPDHLEAGSSSGAGTSDSGRAAAGGRWSS